MNKSIAHIVVGLPVEGPFDYSVPEAYRNDARLGMRVCVSFARRKRVGFIVGFADKSDFPKLNPVLALLDEEPTFAPGFIALAEVFALRFGCSTGEALELFLPQALRGMKKLIVSAESGKREAGSEKGPLFDSSGSPGLSARTGRRPASSSTELIFDRGLTRRWEILGPLVRETLSAGRGVLCLVPDATYLEVVLPRLRDAGADPVVLSQGTDRDELDRWSDLRNGRARTAVGFISAVFAPLRALGLIILIDEESHSYKHDQSPFYHARDAVLLRGRLEQCRVALVSSAPSVEAWHEAARGKARLEVLKDALPPVKFMDLSNFKMKKDTFVSQQLRQHMERTLKSGQKVLLYIQAARGVAGVVEEVRSSFPGATVQGYDRESGALADGCQIVVATQAIFRHRHDLRFGIAVVLDIDWELHKSDHRAAQSAFALTQYLRQMAKDFVLLQTRHMENELLHFFADEDSTKFYQKELSLRKEMGLPPFNYLVALVARSSDPQLACDEAKRLYDSLVVQTPDGVEVHEPQQDRSAVVRGKFRWCVMLQGRSLKAVMGLVKATQRQFRGKKDTVVTVNVDP
jgi:primosomal protein N'